MNGCGKERILESDGRGDLRILYRSGILGKDFGVTCETHNCLTFCNEGSSRG